MFVVPRFGALRWTAPAAFFAALLATPAAPEGLPEPSRQANAGQANAGQADARQADARQANASDFATLSSRAEAAREGGRLDEAVSLYRKALALRPAWKEGWWALGTILYEQDAHNDAGRAFRRLISLDPKNGTAHLLLALCEYQLDADASAMKNIQIAKSFGVQTDGGLPHVLMYHEGMLLLRAGRYERSIETLKPLVSAGVEDENLELALGMGVLLMRPKEAPAEASPTRAVVKRAGRAERQHMAKEFAAAKREYVALVQEAPAFPNVHYAYGRFLLATEDLESGIQEFVKEIEAHPEHVRAHVQVAAARYRLDSPDGLPFAREVVKLAPDYPFGHYLLGLLYFDTGDLAHAIPELETAARMLPDEAQFQFALGNAYARAGRAEEAARARAAFTRLNKKEPSDADADALRRLDLDSATSPAARPSSRPATRPTSRPPIKN
jgi:tetratricopeptide (TPR) repeat protein